VVTDDATTGAGAGAGVPMWQRIGLGYWRSTSRSPWSIEVLADTGAVQRRVRRLPSRVVVWFVLALTLFHGRGIAACGGS